MIALFDFLFYGHVHKWKIIEKIRLKKYENDCFIGNYLVMQCDHCGNVKRKKLEA